MLPPIVFWLMLLAVNAYAFHRGKLDERLAALICFVGTLATVSVSTVGRNYAEYSNIEVGILLIDSLTLLGFVLLALRSRRFWPLWVAGLQLTSVFAHFLKAIRWELLPQVYAVAERFWVYPIFLIIVIGTWRGHQRLRRQEDESFLRHAT